MKHRSLLGALAFLAAAGSASAQNQLANSTFATELPPWNAVGSVVPDPVGTGAAAWTNAFNLDNLPGSGSADTTLAGLPSQPANASFGIRQCVTLPGAPLTVTEANYEASFLARVTGNPTDGLANATVEVRFFSDSGCTTFVPGAGGSQGVDLAGTILDNTQWWTTGDPQFLPTGGSIVASSAEVHAYVRTVSTTSNAYRVFFDHIILSLNGTVPIELLHFEIE